MKSPPTKVAKPPGRRGPPPAPYAVRLARGNGNQGKPLPDAMSVVSPDQTISHDTPLPAVVAEDEVAAYEWRRIVDIQQGCASGTGAWISASDAMTLQLYCMAYSDWIRNRQAMSAQRNDAMTQARSAARQMLQNPESPLYRRMVRNGRIPTGAWLTRLVNQAVRERLSHLDIGVLPVQDGDPKAAWKINPRMTLDDRLTRKLQQLAVLLGLTPAVRARIAVMRNSGDNAPNEGHNPLLTPGAG